VTYNAANQMLAMTSSWWGNETRSYNSLNQLVGLSNINVNASYNYTAGSDNGKIASAYIGGETVTYQYDSLNRLISAAGSSGWGDSYGYDSYGNLLSKTVTAGSAPTLSISVNSGSNQLDGSGDTYDANGNQLTGLSSQYFTYDSENRMIGAYTNGSDYVQYAYDSQNKRVFSSPYASGSQGPQHVYFYGVDGQQLGAYPLSSGASALEISTYFGSKRLGFNTNPNNGSETATAPDRLGSYGSYYPWGESKSGNNPADIWSYATYWRDSLTGLDYANQRYYSNVQGRFMTPDPHRGSAHTGNPQSWNRYGYVLSDPVNGSDPTGLDQACEMDTPLCTGGVEYPTDINVGGDLVWDPTCSCLTGVVITVDDPQPSDPNPDPDPDPDPAPDPTSGDPGDDPPLDPLTNPPTASSCVAQSIGLGTAIGGWFGSVAGGVAGGVGGAASGTSVLPGFGTIVAGLEGLELGATGGALAGGSIGGALGGLLGSIFCSAEHTSGARPRTRDKHQKGKGRKRRDRINRRDPRRKPPKGWTGQWPPKPGTPWR